MRKYHSYKAVKVIELQVSYICIASRLPLLDLQKENGARMLTVP